MKKIVVVGANQCALVFAEFAASCGFEVCMYEAAEKENVAYDWTDDLAPETFSDIGLPLPPKEIYHVKRPWTFVPPKKGCLIPLQITADESDISVARRPLNDWLSERALKAGAKIYYGKAVERAYLEDGAVKGIVLSDGNKVASDLVVDCGGVQSAVRQSLSKSLGIPSETDFKNTFFVRRTFFERPADAGKPEYTNKAYLKHNDEAGISWCLLSEDGKCADVLVGRVGEMSDETYNTALSDLRRDNPIIGDKAVKGGELLIIPVRHPISRMFAEGYVLLGDSAYMTIPMLGSGMASGMRAALFLAEVIAHPVGEPFSNENLYRYQKRFMAEIGGKHAAIDLMKNWLLGSKPGELDFLLESKIVANKELKLGAAGEVLNLSPVEMADKAAKGWKKLPLLLRLAGLLQSMQKQLKVASKMPDTYSEEDFAKWQEKYEQAYKK